MASLTALLLLGAAQADRWQRLRGGPEGAADVDLAWGRWGDELTLFARGDGAIWRLEGREWRRLAYAAGTVVGPLADPGQGGVAWTEAARLHRRDADSRRSAVRELPWAPAGGRADGDGLLLWSGSGLLDLRGPRPSLRRIAAGPVSEAAMLPAGVVIRDDDRLTGSTAAGPADRIVACGEDLWIQRQEAWHGPSGRTLAASGQLGCAGPGIVAAAAEGAVVVAGPAAQRRIDVPHPVNALAALAVGDELRLAVAGAGGVFSLLRTALPQVAPAAATAPPGLRPFAEVLAAVLRQADALAPDAGAALTRIRRSAWAPGVSIDGDLSGSIDEDWRWAPTSSLSSTSRSILVGPHLLTVDGGAGRRWSAGMSLKWSLDRLLWERDELQIWRQQEREAVERERRAALAAALWTDLADPATPAADRRRAEALLHVLTGGESPWFELR